MADGAFIPLSGDADQLHKLKRMLDDARRDPDNNRIQQELDRDYYDGNQLTPEMRSTLKARKQPEIVRNHVKNAVNGVVGVIDSNRTDPRAYPREPSDEDASDVASDVLRYCADISHFGAIKSDCLENGLIEGCYAVIIEGGPDQDPSITQIRAEEFFFDPRARRPDFKDARYLGVAKWMYADQVASTYQGDGQALNANDVLTLASSNEMMGDMGAADTTWEDRPDDATTGGWIDQTLKRVLVVEVYFQEQGAWNRALFCAAGLLEPIAPSAYEDDRGRSKCPIVAQSAYVDRKNNRYGIVRDMRGPQDGINMMASRALHAANSRQIQQTDMDAPPVDVEIARQEAARPDGVIPPGWQVRPQTDLVSGNLQFMEELKDEIQRMSPNPAIVGRGSADASGRAIQVRQQAGLVELARVLGRFSDWELRVYRGVWACVRQFWQAPKWIRTLGDEGAYNMVQVNEIEQPGVPAIDPNGQPVTDPQTGQPQYSTPPKIRNMVARMDIDITVDTVPDTPNLQQEVWAELIKLIGSNPIYAQQVPFSLAVQMSPLPRKRELLQQIEQASQQKAQAQAGQQLVEAQSAQAKVQLDQAKAAHQDALAGKVQAQTKIDAIQAHTGLMDHQVDATTKLDDSAVQKAAMGLEIERFKREAHNHGPFAPQNAPPA